MSMTVIAALRHMRRMPDRPWSEAAPWYAAHMADGEYRALAAWRRARIAAGRQLATTRAVGSVGLDSGATIRAPEE